MATGTTDAVVLRKSGVMKKPVPKGDQSRIQILIEGQWLDRLILYPRSTGKRYNQEK
jgi:hypothetical protein